MFQGSLVVAIILIDGREKPNRQLGFELQSSHVRNNLKGYMRHEKQPEQKKMVDFFQALPFNHRCLFLAKYHSLT